MNSGCSLKASNLILTDKTKMVKNIKYLRWATKVLKIIVVLNILSALWGLYLNLAGAEVVLVGTESINNKSGLLTTGSYAYTAFVGIFMMYTAARGLELFADVTEKILTPIEPQAQTLAQSEN